MVIPIAALVIYITHSIGMFPDFPPWADHALFITKVMQELFHIIHPGKGIEWGRIKLYPFVKIALWKCTALMEDYVLVIVEIYRVRESA